jgi:HK97 family phage major capsid protein
MKSLRDLRDGTVGLGPRGTDFTRSIMAVATAQKTLADAGDYAASRWGSRAGEVTRAAVNALTTANSPDAAAFQGAATEFFQLVAERSILGRLAGLRRVPLHRRFMTATGATGYWVAQGAAKPVSSMTFATTTLPPLKIAAMTVTTDELLTSSDPAAEAVIRADLLRAVVEALDLAFIDPGNAGVAGQTPASITDDVTPASSTGNPAADLKALIGGFGGDLETSYFVMDSTTAVHLAGTDRPDIGARGGSLYGVPVITSGHVADGTVVLLDPGGLAYAEGAAQVKVSREASILMDSAPAMASAAGSPSEPIAAALVSLWQCDAAAVLVERDVNWMQVRPFAVSVLIGVGVGSPG